MNVDGSNVRALIDCRRTPGACPDPAAFGHVDNLAWSSDGSRLAFNGTGGGIWVVGVDGSRLMGVPGRGVRWSPTGSRLAFQAALPYGFWSGGTWVIDADAPGLLEVAPVGRDPVWSPDGSRIAYLDEASLYVANLDRIRADGTHDAWSVVTLGALAPPHRPTPVVWMPLPASASGGE